MIDSTDKPTIVHTDHAATTSLAAQTTLTTSNTDKLNLRLIHASQYLSQFRLDIRHIQGKTNIVPDALSRLLQSKIDRSEDESLENLYAFHVALVELSDAFKDELRTEYEKDNHWRKVLNLLEDYPDGHKLPGIKFHRTNDLIYYADEEDGRDRLCIPNSLEKQIFEMAHDNHHHSGFHRTYVRVTASTYIRRLSKHLKMYILHCPDCQQNQTSRDRPHGDLNPIVTPPIPFHTIAMDLIVKLPPTEKGLDTLMTVTDKFSRRVALIPGKETYKAQKWAEEFLNGTTEWGIPKAIISDRDSRFLSNFWKGLFSRLGTKLLTSTAYHPQTDGLSERMNQTVEIALRYYLSKSEDTEWTKFLPILQRSLNNSPNTATTKSPNEILYGFKVREPTSVFKIENGPESNLETARDIHRQDAIDAMAFANADAKLRYDARHKPLKLNAGDKVFLRLHNGYRLPGEPNRKFSSQRVGPFSVVK